MKNFTSTAVMGVLVALLAGYTFYEYKNASEDAMQEQGEAKPFSITREKVEAIRLTVNDRKTVLKKDGDKWKLIEPVQDDGEPATIDGFLYTLLSQKLKSFRSDEEAKNTAWSEFGLEPAPLKIEVEGQGKTEAIEVSTKAAFDGKSYVRFQDQVWLGDIGLPQQAQREPNSFRSRKLWRDEGEIEGVKVTMDHNGRKESFHLKFKEGWQAEPAAPFAIDSDKVRNWLDLVRGPAISDFASEELTDASRQTYLLKKPSYLVELELKPKDGVKNWLLTVGQDRSEEVFLFTNTRDVIYKSEGKNLEGLRVGLEHFRDGKAPFRFPIEQARSIETRLPKKSLSFRKDDSGWVMAETKVDEELNQEKLVQMIQNLQNLEAKEFIKSAPKGLPPTPQVVVKGGKGETLLSLAWGDEYKSQVPPNKGMTMVFVKTNNEKVALGLPKEKLTSLIDESIVQKKTPAKGSEQK